MSVLGLIVEYNPFHNGHLYHFNTSLDLTQAEYSVCVMSGNFVQRGEPAIVDKWSRTLMALKAGIDLVIELPVIYSVQSAEIFAYGAISILNSTGIVDKICFGSEAGDLGLLKKIASVICSEPDGYKRRIKFETAKGNSFAVSRAKAVLGFLENDLKCHELEELKSILQSSNNILGFEYIKWLYRLNSPITPVTIKRMHSNYNDASIDTPFASALAVRKAIKETKLDTISDQIPLFTMDILKNQFSSGKGPVYLENFSQAILCQIRKMPPEDISKVMDVNEGLEYRIKKASIMSGDISQLVDRIKSKRYTETRIKRILVHLLLGMYKKDLKEMNNAGGPQYIRVLGFTEKGKMLLAKMKKSCRLPIITNVGDYRKYNSIEIKKMMDLDILSTDIYVTAYKEPHIRTGGCDFYYKPIIL